jgi:hypothetical protein
MSASKNDENVEHNSCSRESKARSAPPETPCRAVSDVPRRTEWYRSSKGQEREAMFASAGCVIGFALSDDPTCSGRGSNLAPC